MSGYYDRKGNPIDRMTWAKMVEERQNKRVLADGLPGDVRVSTVWLGLDHQWGDGPPLIFETMIFGGEHSDWQDRYSTEAEAIAGHRRVVASLRAGRDLDEGRDDG